MAPRQHGGSSAVGYVLSSYPVISQTFIRNEVAALRDAGVDVRVWTMGGGDGDVVDPAWSGPWRVLHEVPWRRAVADGLWWSLRPRAVLRLLRALRTCRFAHPDLVLRGVFTAARDLRRAGAVVCHSHFGWKANAPALYVGALVEIPTTVTVHAADIFMPHANLGDRLRAMGAVVTVCQSNVPHVTALGVAPERVHVVACGVDTGVSEPAPPADPGRLVSVGRLVPKKGFDLLLDAFASVVRVRPGATLRIIGDGPLREELEAQASRLGLGKSVSFLGSMAHEQVLREVDEAAAYVLACRRLPDGDSDAMPVAIREAMVRARPVVSTDVAGIPESVDETVGWVVPQNDPLAMAQALADVTGDADEARRRGRAARERAVQRWGLQTSRADLQRIWNGLDSDGGAGAEARARSEAVGAVR